MLPGLTKSTEKRLTFLIRLFIAIPPSLLLTLQSQHHHRVQLLIRWAHQQTLGSAIFPACPSLSCTQGGVPVLNCLSSPPPIHPWNLLIRQSVKSSHLYAALSIFSRLRLGGAQPDEFTFPFVLKACGGISSYRVGALVHGLALRAGYDSNVFVCNALISMYSQCRALDDARHVFDEITQQGLDDLVSWNSIVASYVKCGFPLLALRLFEGMGMMPDVISLVNVLPACAVLKCLPLARQIHAQAIRRELCSDVFVANAVIDAYAKCGAMENALRVFRGMGSGSDVVSWNAMVTGYSQNGIFGEAFMLFEEMKKLGIELNVVTWSALIAGYAQRGHGREALSVFQEMQMAGSKPNSVTIISTLSACASVGAHSQGMELHAHALRRCLVVQDDCGSEKEEEEEDLVVANGLIDMYSKCKDLDSAHLMFSCIPVRKRNVVTWTALIGGCAQHGDANHALELFSSMLRDGSSLPNAFTVSCALMACARLSALRFGREIHAFVFRNRCGVMFVGNCLIDMYAKCGHIDAAGKVFAGMPHKNHVSWTSLMAGYGMHGQGDDALSIFEEMRRSGPAPDGVTLLVLLYACSHSGMVEQGMKHFERMGEEHGVVAGVEHYACLIDLLGRVGRLDEAWEKVNSMPVKPSPAVWLALLGACRTHSNVELGELAFRKLQEMGCMNDGACTLLSNIYAKAGLWAEVARIRGLMRDFGIRKRPGCSWITGKKGMTTFFVGDRSHPESEKIYALLGSLMERIRALGYVPKTGFALHDVGEEEKGNLLSEHSEKLALAYGILCSPAGAAIRITKNLRVCGDCHSAISFISMIVDHEIILRDSNRFHHFKIGSCSCNGFW